MTIQPGPTLYVTRCATKLKYCAPGPDFIFLTHKRIHKQKYTLKTKMLVYLPLINGLAPIVIHSSHLSDNALIHYTNKHIHPGYLCVCFFAMLVVKQEAENSRWCWLINWQVNFQMDNESKTLRDGRLKSLALCSTLDAVPSIYYWQNHN